MPFSLSRIFRILPVLLFFGQLTFAEEGATQPNVVLIMTDDQGYGDLSITGNTIVQTPHMDSLARDGVWLKQFYVSPVCTPTRAHLMTGRYGFRTRAIDTYLGRAVLEPDEITLAEMLAQAGYATGIFGKWHLGDYFPTRPGDQGFSESLVHQGGGLRQPSNPPEGERYHDPILFHNGVPERVEGYCTDIFFDAAADFIDEQVAAEKPFFAYIPTNAPHGPFDEPPSRAAMEHFQALLPDDRNSNRAGFYAMIHNVDENIGRLLTHLKELEIDRDTLVVFLTDNGPSAGSSGPFRGSKGSVYEGGIRTVCFMKWPGHIAAGTESTETAAHIDLTPTILALCGITPATDPSFDGINLLPRLTLSDRRNGGLQPERPLFLQWHRGDVPVRYHHFAAIDPTGRWKLLNRSNPGQHTPAGEATPALYDLQNDMAETTDVAKKYPEITERLLRQYDAWFDDVCSTRSPNFGMPPIVIGAPEQRGVVLTPQDKRVDSDDRGGWWAPGTWPVDVRDSGPYTLQILLTEVAAEDLIVDLKIDCAEKFVHRECSVPRGADTAVLGNFRFPATGEGRITCRVRKESRTGPHVYQVTIR